MTNKNRKAMPAWELHDLLSGTGNGFFTFSEMDTLESRNNRKALDQEEFTPAELEAQRFCIEIFETENDSRLIAALLRMRVPLSMDIREMLASALESGRIKPHRSANRPEKSRSEQIIDDMFRTFARNEYRNEIERIQRDENKSQDEAIQKFADITGRTYDQVKNTLYYKGMEKKSQRS